GPGGRSTPLRRARRSRPRPREAPARDRSPESERFARDARETRGIPGTTRPPEGARELRDRPPLRSTAGLRAAPELAGERPSGGVPAVELFDAASCGHPLTPPRVRVREELRDRAGEALRVVRDPDLARVRELQA